jgi:hypothetical protein
VDWSCLLIKIEKKISDWCYKWLSLGGRIIMLKAVLESQSIYWMAVELIPKFIINQIHKMCFNFLWNGNNTTSHIHLCSWEVLSRPKSSGGWGLKNLAHFNITLLANTLWHTLFHKGIWHNIVMDKYIRHYDVIKWFRSTNFEYNLASRIWRNLLKSVHLLLHWQSWLPGSGEQILIGRDYILGMGENYLLSQALRDHLSRKEIKLLANAKNPQGVSDFSDIWLCSLSLGLNGTLAEEWNNFTKGLSTAGVYLGEENDTLLWAGGDASGKITVKNIYLALVSTLNYQPAPKWIQKIWSWDIQLKIKLFTWLTISRKILTWDGLQKRGWEGPGICIFCKRNSESLEHLFINYSFTKQLWAMLKYLLNLKRIWSGEDIVVVYYQWIFDKSVLPEIAALTCWCLWIERNKCIFENKTPSVHSVLHKIMGLLDQRIIMYLNVQQRNALYNMKRGLPLLFSTGLEEVTGQPESGIIKTTDKLVYRWFFNCGGGTNSKAELLGIWASLTLANYLDIHRLQAFGDSKVIIEWLNDRGKLDICAIEGWKKCIKVL